MDHQQLIHISMLEKGNIGMIKLKASPASVILKDLLTGMESVSLTIREGKGYLEDFPF